MQAGRTGQRPQAHVEACQSAETRPSLAWFLGTSVACFCNRPGLCSLNCQDLSDPMHVAALGFPHGLV